MCGICGIASTNGSGITDRVAAMSATLVHRGPDSSGEFSDQGVALAARRLSIIDLETGDQPVANENETVHVIQNGEIYNYRELRRELERAGHSFRTQGDTEVLLHLYEEHGDRFAERLRGMFAAAIWDASNRRLVLARDRFGIKPLYYRHADNELAFASELRALPRGEIDLDALEAFLAFNSIPAPLTIFREVRKLPPGHLLIWEDGRLELRRFARPAPLEELREDEEAELVEELRSRLRDSVRAHLVSDVPVGVLLSGGVDSAFLAALAAEESAEPLRTFSIGFEERSFDELAGARLVAERYGTQHQELVLRPDAALLLPALADAFDEPFADSSAIPTWYVSEMARRHVTVVLSGDGGDELFGGYDRYVPHPRVVAFDRYSPRALRRVAAIAAARLPHGVRGKNFLRHVGRDDRGRYLDAIRFFGTDEKPALLTADARRRMSEPDAEHRLARHFERYAQLPWPSQMMRFDAETYLPEDVLTKVDRMSMAHSIESRVPLLDNEVVAFASTLPASLKIKNGRRKHVLKEVAATLLPREILNRKKQGFGVPLGVWFRGNLRELFSDTLLSSTCLQRGYFQPAFVRQIVNEHLSGKRDHTLRLWQLVVFERWHQQYVNREAGKPLRPSA
ncbi:MAG: asparagine synthase (glutamine-hydrolyzing), partial [Gaiellaceae bacterium]